MNKICTLISALILVWSCTTKAPDKVAFVDTLPQIFPKNYQTTIPVNIAPINFRVDENASKIFVSIKGVNGTLENNFNGNKTNWTIKEWSAFLRKNQNDSIQFSVFCFTDDEWKQFRSFSYFITPDPIDEYLMYRLISPGYQTWNKMGLYQRQLTTFKQETILDNKIMPHSCMNCHTMASNNPDNMVFHIRENNSGTILIRNRHVEKLVSQKPTPFKSVSFPYWHPSAKYIAFSINKVRQVFPSKENERAHAFDMESDMVIYDLEKQEYFTSPLLYSENSFEAFPCFSPDGKSLYFITAPAAPMPRELRNIQYSLCRVDFNPATATLGEKADTLITPKQTGKSLTMPRISPDGEHILLTLSNYGNFPAYNEEADLYMYNVTDSSLIALDNINSNQVESYHSWSSSGKWIVFSSRRMDGLFMNAYIAHINENGIPDKPFLLPQKDPDFHRSFLFSFNLPEFAIKPIPLSAMQIEKVAKRTNNGKRNFETTH